MRILVANDDGVEAPGLRLLARAALALAPDVWIVAPERKWTAASHQLSFDQDLTLRRTSDRTYACSGAPADCIVGAMTVLFVDAPKPDLVLAGINDKRNVGEDLAYSGTTAIAREASFWGVPAIALSRDRPAKPPASDLQALRRLLALLWETRARWTGEGRWLGVNLPARLPAPLVQTHTGRDKIGSTTDVLERSPDRIRYRLRRGRPGGSRPGDESAALSAGAISVVRYRWFPEDRLPERLFGEWNDALG
ncbi:MAG TPA: 5'/3'-nucleotidase SurE [Casimicrobiaceae bacterium]